MVYITISNVMFCYVRMFGIVAKQATRLTVSRRLQTSTVCNMQLGESILVKQIRNLSITPQVEMHQWMERKYKTGKPYKFDHPRQKHFKYGLL